MNRGKSAQNAQRCQSLMQPNKAQQQQQQQGSQKKKRSSSSSPSPSKNTHCGSSSSRISVTAGDAPTAVQSNSKPGGTRVALECPKEDYCAQRKLSVGSTSDSDSSRDSGCASHCPSLCSSPSPKSSSPDSGSESSDKLQGGESPALRNGEPEETELLSWTDGIRADDDDSSPDRSTPRRGGGKGDDLDDTSSGLVATRTTGTTTRELRVSGGDPLRSSDAAGDSGGGFLGFGGGGFLGDVLGTSSSSGSGSGTYLDPAAAHGGPMMMMMMMMDDTTEDLVRDMEDLRSENEYLKDEVEELRCELVEVRDMFHQEEAERLQALTLQVEQANRTCRILQYRLRKAERRSIRVAQGGHVDGELVRSLEHDIKVAKCVSVRVHRELEAVQKKASRLEEENEALREKMEELEVSRMVLQAHMDKTRESSLKRRGVRSTGSKAERRLSQHLEEDSADLKLQLHLAKEELSLVCKKLARLVADSEGTRQELARYRAAYGDVDHACAHAATTTAPPAVSSALAREAEVKVHLRLVEEEATLLSRRIVELEVENRGLRAEMSDLGERGGGGGALGGGEEEEEEEEEEAEGGEPSPPGADDLSPTAQQGETEDGGRGLTAQRGEDASLRGQSEDGTSLAVCQITREGPVGGERDPAESPERDADKQQSRGLDYETLLALRGHSCVVSAAIRVLLLTASSQALSPAKEVGGDAAETPGVLLRGPLKDALEILQSMLADFAGRTEERVTTAGGTSLLKDGREWDISYVLSPAPGGRGVRGEEEASIKAASAEDLRTTEVKQRAQLQRVDCAQTSVHGHRAEDLLGLTFQILWLLHQWWEMKASGLEGKEVRDKTMPVLRSLLEELGADMINDATPPQSSMTECAVNTFFDEEKLSEADRSYSSKGKRRRRLYAPYGSNLWWKKKNWVYVSQEAAQADVEDRVRTWDHPIMALSFPELDFERVQADRSHTAPETTAARVYYSPPSARRVQLAHLHNKQRSVSPVDRTSATDVDSPPSASVSWFTPPSSLSALCLGLSSNLSDDMKEITAGLSPGLRQPVHSASLERRKARGLDVSCSATQTHMMQPQMVSVGLQTDVPQRSGGPPGRAVLSARSTSSLERPGGRVERPRPSSSSTSPSTSSPKLFRRHSASSTHSYSTSSPLAGPTSTPTAAAAAPPSRERGSWSNGVTPSWSSASGTANNRAGVGGGHNNNGSGGGALKSDGGESSTRADGRTNATTTKPPSKAGAGGGGGRYGMVTEFLRRVSGRAADSKTPGGPMAAQAAAGTSKSGGSFKHLERAVPSRTPPPPGGQGPALQRNDSVTRIVNQRFMKQREDRGQSNGQREDRGQSNGSARGAVPARNHGSASVAAEVRAAEDGSYDIGSSSSRTLSFCFARPSRSAQRQQASQCSKPPQRHRATTSLPGTN